MKIKNLIENIKIIKKVNFNEKTLNLNIKSICDNSTSKNIKNSLFVCIDGFNFNSHNLAPNFKNLGVRFVVCNKDIETTLPYIIVENTREILGILCDNFYSHPTKNFALIGVIGTNGKTSTSNFIRQIIELNGKKCALIGTSGVFVNNKKFKETLTTPDPILLYKFFSLAKKQKCDFVVMEISAHAIQLKKVANLVCDMVCFTNFSQDHLDFFGNMEAYKQTKFSFFNAFNTKNAIINIDDEDGKELYEKINQVIPTRTFSAMNENANFCAKNLELVLNKTNFVLKTPKIEQNVEVFVPCKFNVYNILCAIGVCESFGLNVGAEILKGLKRVQGRFDAIKLKNNCFVIIDYAHTPESLETLLESVKKLSRTAKISIVFGCPGNRDELKREIMGKIAYKHCEKIYITTDNPNFENPLIICSEILRGAKEKGVIIENRQKAIKTSIENLNENEVLCVVGKGSETYQIINNKKFRYCDYKVVFECIKKLKKQ